MKRIVSVPITIAETDPMSPANVLEAINMKGNPPIPVYHTDDIADVLRNMDAEGNRVGYTESIAIGLIQTSDGINDDNSIVCDMITNHPSILFRDITKFTITPIYYVKGYCGCGDMSFRQTTLIAFELKGDLNE